MTDHLRGSVNRRTLFTYAAAGAALPSLLSACGSGSGTSNAKATVSDSVLPTYVQNELVTPDIPGVNGSDPAYLTYPTDAVKTVTTTPGKGGSYKTITPLWGSIPEKSGNPYYEAVNKAIGATLDINPADGNTYGDMLPTLFSSDKLPDWICIPSWNTTNLNFGKAVGAKLTDLTDYLAGDAVKEYPNLANLPTTAWKAGVWNNRLYGIPLYSSGLTVAGTIYYRKDIVDTVGLAEPTNSEELKAFGAALTDEKGNRWAFDNLWPYLDQPFKVPGKWYQDASGNLKHRYESDEFYAALEFLREMFDAGYVHPDAVAGNTADAKQRFASGETVVYADGTGAWGEAVSTQAAANNTAFVMQAMAPFDANGGTPTYERGASAGMFSYLNKNLSSDQVKELLAIANFIAAPFGSYEYTLVNYGPEGTTWTMEDAGPTLTEEGGSKVNTTYQFLATCPTVVTKPGYDDFVKAYAAWQAKAAAVAFEPLFFALNVTEPSQYSSIGTPVEDAIQDYLRGRKTLDEMKSEVTSWRNKGGDKLREFYQGQLDGTSSSSSTSASSSAGASS